MSITPLALYQLWLEDGESFNVHKASSDILIGMVKSRFIGRVNLTPTILINVVNIVLFDRSKDYYRWTEDFAI